MALTERANQVMAYEDGTPAVIVLKKYVRKFPFSLNCNRKNIFWRDDYQCQYCTKPFKHSDLTMDHVMPKSKGGPKIWENIVTCCKGCNGKKKNRTPKEANMPLLRRPYIPRVKMIDLYRNIEIPEEWKDFL